MRISIDVPLGRDEKNRDHKRESDPDRRGRISVEKRVTPFGNSVKVDAPKRYRGRRA